MMPVCTYKHVLRRYPGYSNFKQTKLYCDKCSKQIELNNDSYVWHCKGDPEELHPRCVGVFYCDECV